MDLSDRKASLDMVLVAPRNKSVYILYIEASPVNSLDCCASLLYHEMHRNFTTHHRSQRMHRRVMNLNWELPVMSAAKPWSSQVLHCDTNPRMSQDSKRRRCQLYKDKYRSPATRSLHIHWMSTENPLEFYETFAWNFNIMSFLPMLVWPATLSSDSRGFARAHVGPLWGPAGSWQIAAHIDGHAHAWAGHAVYRSTMICPAVVGAC